MQLKVKQKEDKKMGNNFKFRSALKTDKHSIIIPIENINRQGYTIDINVAEDVFEKKYSAVKNFNK